MELENFVALEKSLPGNKYKETFNALLRKESVPPVYLMRGLPQMFGIFRMLIF